MVQFTASSDTIFAWAMITQGNPRVGHSECFAKAKRIEECAERHGNPTTS